MTAVDFPGDNKNSTCREEFTLDDVEQMKTQLLAASMPEKDVNILGHVFTKMTSNTTDAEKMDGLVSGAILRNIFVMLHFCFRDGTNFENRMSRTYFQMKLLMLIYAIDRNKTEEELLKLIESYDSSEVEEKVNPKKEIKNIL